MTIPEFGWKNDEKPDMDAENLESMHRASGEYTDAQITALLFSAAFSGAPTAPTQAENDNSTKIATTAYADRAAAKAIPLSQKGAISGVAALGPHGAVQSAASGSFNTSMGESALASNLYAQGNIAIGFNALTLKKESKTKGEAGAGGGNIAIGVDALEQLTEGPEGAEQAHKGEENTVVGRGAGKHLTIGSGNTALGHGAFEESKEGSYNTALGTNALTNVGNAKECLAVGHLALQGPEGGVGTVTIEGNVALGTLSQWEIETNGNFNTSVGYKSLESVKTGVENVAIGNEAGVSITTAKQNVFVGAKAGNKTTGSENVFIGDQTNREGTSAGANIAIGHRAMLENKSGGKNTIVGFEAGESSTAGEACVFIGYKSGKAETNSNRLYIANSETTEPIIFGVFPNTELLFNVTKIALYKGVTPVVRASAITSPEANSASLKVAVDALREAVKKIGITE